MKKTSNFRFKNQIDNPHLTHVIVTKAAGTAEDFGVDLEIISQNQTEVPKYNRSELEGISQLVLSSGTSGTPKPIKITCEMIINNCLSLVSEGALVYDDGSVTLLAQPLAHIGGHNFAFLDFTFNGANFVVTDYPGSLGLLEIIQKYKLTHVFAVPSVLNFLAKFEHLEDYDLSSWKYILTGATKPNFETIETIKRRSGNSQIVVKNIYGASEQAGLTFATNDSVESKLESMGVALPGVKFKLVDVDQRSKVIVEPNKEGELLIKQAFDYLMYFNDPQKTQESLTSDGFYLTGDLAVFDDNFNLYIQSRIKDVVKYRGFSVSPAELEEVLMESALVADCSVVAQPDDANVEIPVAFVVATNEGLKLKPEVVEQTLLHHVTSRVAEHKKLWRVYLIDKIPRNGNGKVLKRVLREKFL